MEVKLWALINIVILIVLIERSNTETGSLSTEEPIIVETNDGTKQCTTKLRTCKMNLPHGSLIGKQGDRGEKGEKGMAGLKGSKGTKGDPGDRGDHGLDGSPGLNGTHGNHGEKGDKGDHGFQGMAGLPGSKGTKGNPGETGDHGLDGMAGLPGSKGTKGDPGEKGDHGLDGSPGLNGTHGNHGEKGDKGDRGLPGSTGLPGSKGMIGDPGEKGNQGLPGLPGDTGKEGSRGETGIKGERGDTGLTGDPGSPGIKGNAGIKGEIGETGPSTPGPIGPPGLPGTPGACACEPFETSEDYDGEGLTVFGKKSKPATVPCKYSPKYSTSGNYYFYPDEPFKAYCNKEVNTTCIVPENLSMHEIKSKSINYKDVEKPFWLTTQGVDIKDIYGLTASHIKWLQKYSASVTMTLRYHCKNSIPFQRKDPKTDASKSMKMLTWSELLIGPYPSETTPFFYSVPPESDECQDSDKFKSEWRHSDIILRSPNVYRLPIQDFYITDVRNEDQSVYIELIELCFA